ncbi:MAG: apolipoprotein N-acyltransferase [Proteobacteria bacterium]|nr:apolipoprotein N-acyltransferase [Pseudomonadota bacterium]MBU1594667.1 apolipoprotein N-acyltransferase [Pseudomonadota bacterium]
MRPRYLFILATAVGTWLGHANPLVQLPLAALLLPAGLMVLGQAATVPGVAFRQAWLAGSLAALGCLYWVYWPVQHFGGVHWLLAAPVPVLLSLAMGAYFGLFGLAAHYSARRLSPLQSLIFLGLCWSLMEMAVATFFSGFPWLTLSAAFVPWTIVVLPAADIGAYGLSGVLAVIACGAVHSRGSRSCAVASASAVVLVLGLGLLHLRAYAEDSPPRTVAVVQGNIDQSLKWDPAYQQTTVSTYVDLSRKVLATARPELIVWPETSMPFYFQDDSPLRKPVLDFVSSTNATLLLGAPAYSRQLGDAFTLFNRAFLLGGAGVAPDWYDKEHLVPFGEYMPLPSWLPLEKLVNGVGDFVPGRDQKAIRSGDLALGVLICYEAIFPGLAQERVSQGANIIVILSNDAWFGATSAPMQHLNLTALRAIEQGRWIVRSTNTGISAFIDPLGRVQRAGPQFEALAAAGRVYPRTRTTLFHTLYGPLLLGAGVLAALFAALFILGGRSARPGNQI